MLMSPRSTPWSSICLCFIVKSDHTAAFLPPSSSSALAFTRSPSTITAPERALQHPSRSVDKGRTMFSPLKASAIPNPSSLYFARIVFLRGLAFVYGVAFLVAKHQNKALIGDNGITPARRILDQAQTKGIEKKEQRRLWLLSAGNRATSYPIRFLRHRLNQQEWYQNLREALWDRSDRLDRPVTTLLWLAPDRNHLNAWLDTIANSGMAISVLVCILGSANVPLLMGLWLCQRSLMAVGGPWYGYGWEPQLAELGFHSLFLVPFVSLDPFVSSVPVLPVWAMRWFLFRIMMGAGLIKIKGDKKWKDLTAMNYFYETQPVPNPFSKYFHWKPEPWHKFEVLSNHFVELIAPFLLILPGLSTRWRRAGGLIQMVFQGILIISGNLSFLNWLTLLPAIFCLDDAFLGALLFSPTKRAAASLAVYAHAVQGTATAATTTSTTLIRRLVSLAFSILIGRLSVPVVKNLLSKRQLMNSSFDPLRLVNTYGAFGSVNDDRCELIVSSASNISGPWKEYDFKVKPGDVKKPPRWISPYHYRLDWQMWISCTIGSIERSPWMYRFLLLILQEDEEVLGLLADDPWRESALVSSTTGDHSSAEAGGGAIKPRYIRVDTYRYKYHEKKPGDQGDVVYWDREYVGRFFPRQGVATLESLTDVLK